MAKKSFGLQVMPITKTDYKKPEKSNQLVNDEKYEKIDNACENGVVLANTGVVYVEEKAISKLFGMNIDDGTYIFDNQIPDKDKKSIAGKDYAHSSDVVGLLDKKAQEVRDTEKQTLLRYSRDSLININDSSISEKQRRQFDSFASKEQKKLRNKRKGDVDEITGEPLKKNYEFHHQNKKSIYTDPEDSIDPDQGIKVNRETHKEIHRRNINDEKQLEEKQDEIRKILKANKK